jgi:DNA polymerase alpha subunit p180 N terminal
MADSDRRPRRAAANRSSTARERIEAAKRKRQDGTLVTEEAPVYDTLNDDEYAQLVAKRRQAGAHACAARYCWASMDESVYNCLHSTQVTSSSACCRQTMQA